MSQVFNRYEKKYLLDEDTYHRVQERLAGHMVADKFGDGDGSYVIHNLYLDTDDDWFIRDSLQHPRYKEKLRLRCYGELDNRSPIYFEIKKKVNRRVNKRRVILTMPEIMTFIETHQPPADSDQNEQVLKEIAYILDGKSPYPKVMLSYDRKAYFVPQDNDLRVTFDTNIRARRTELDFDHESYGRLVLPPKKYIMEVKFGYAYPLWLARVFSELGLSRINYSKYGNEYRQYLHNRYLYGDYSPR
jgi:SPX domain protein involved in polyphosphate accumulation